MKPAQMKGERLYAYLRLSTFIHGQPTHDHTAGGHEDRYLLNRRPPALPPLLVSNTLIRSFPPQPLPPPARFEIQSTYGNARTTELFFPAPCLPVQQPSSPTVPLSSSSHTTLHSVIRTTALVNPSVQHLNGTASVDDGQAGGKVREGCGWDGSVSCSEVET